jgi:hypothetical protein
MLNVVETFVSDSGQKYVQAFLPSQQNDCVFSVLFGALLER